MPETAWIPRTIWLMLALAVVGCTNKGLVNKRRHNADTTSGRATVEERSLRTGAAEIVQRLPDGHITWTAKAKTSLLHISPEGKVSGSLQTVSGELFSKGRSASRFEAGQGDADQATNKLDLSGKVSVSSDQEHARLSAEKVSWLQGPEVIEASGSVYLRTDDYIVGPFEKLWATPDLKLTGTPDMFKHR